MQPAAVGHRDLSRRICQRDVASHAETCNLRMSPGSNSWTIRTASFQALLAHHSPDANSSGRTSSSDLIDPKEHSTDLSSLRLRSPCRTLETGR
jgi:hypothetical protein